MILMRKRMEIQLFCFGFPRRGKFFNRFPFFERSSVDHMPEFSVYGIDFFLFQLYNPFNDSPDARKQLLRLPFG